jgi:flavin-dependent dehydrogenase
MDDLVIVGAGPAGCAAAIWAAERGISVRLIDHSASARHRPGECLHPGVEVLLRDLGVLEEVLARCDVRPLSRTICIGATRHGEKFGSDELGPWRAIHIDRAELDVILRRRARQVGVMLTIQRSRLKPTLGDDGFMVVDMDGKQLCCSFVIDATGHSAWLTRALGRRAVVVSPRMTAFYGYRQGRLVDEQIFQANAAGWQWIAQVAPDILNWTSLQFGVHQKPSPPDPVLSMPPCGISGGADVTWRMAPEVAGPSYFIVGDAALVTDPAAGNGVLRALMSGVKAAHNAHAVIAGRATRAAAMKEYQTWIRHWFQADINRLSAMYRSLAGDWQTPGTVSLAQHAVAHARGRPLLMPLS